MNPVKLSILFLAVLFLASCGKSPTPGEGVNVVNLGRTPSGPANSVPPAGNNAPVSGNVSSAQAGVPRPQLRPAGKEDPVDDSAGDAYAQNCMICHKETGKGGKVTIEGKKLDPIDLTSAKVKARSDEKLLSQIKEGAPDDGMPAFKEKLSDADIMGIIHHIRQLQAAAQ
jgi:mono/diheme cytochrome c family protein